MASKRRQRRNCLDKRAYNTPQEAWWATKRGMRVYRCKLSKKTHYHVGHPRKYWLEVAL